jgi:UDP-N-acetylglucosamine--N-acetylmuramyl-(pentapeptide) pyrophosphoryl-undecaprenol N-acetylglucosamine transferase
MRIVLTGGGTGGHLMPLAAVAKKIKEREPSAEFIFLGPGGELEKKIMEKEGIRMRTITAGKFRRYFSFKNFTDFFKTPVGIIQSLFWLLVYMPDAIFSKGGYASAPVVWAGWAYRIPMMIHESDANPGLANSTLGKLCERVAVSYHEAEKFFPAEQVVLTGNPVRADIAQGDPEKARQMFSLLASRKVIFVVGGSQGSGIINTSILHILPELLKKYQIIHQTGEKNYKEVEHIAGEMGIKAGREGYHPIAFYGDELKDIIAVSDLIISRAGANTIAEIAANGKPSILIPLENSANNHQRMNAYAIAKQGGCVVLEENNLGKNLLMSKIEEIMNNEALYNKLANNIKAFYYPDAADRITDGILGMIKNN